MIPLLIAVVLLTAGAVVLVGGALNNSHDEPLSAPETATSETELRKAA